MWARSTRIVAPRQHVGTSLRQRIHRGRRVDEARGRKGLGARAGLRPREGRRVRSTAERFSPTNSTQRQTNSPRCDDRTHFAAPTEIRPAAPNEEDFIRSAISNSVGTATSRGGTADKIRWTEPRGGGVALWGFNRSDQPGSPSPMGLQSERPAQRTRPNFTTEHKLIKQTECAGCAESVRRRNGLMSRGPKGNSQSGGLR